MTDRVVITTFAWVPKGPRGHVRDLRLRWAAEEAGLDYEIRTVPAVSQTDRGAAHLARQPYGQVPFLDHGEVRLFESGACVLHLAEMSEALMPADPVGRAETVQWIFSALNSVEMVTVPWWFLRMKRVEDTPLAGWMASRFAAVERVLTDRDWLAVGRFTAADILMADVLRVPESLGALDGFPALQAYLARACARPAFRKAHDDQMAHFAAADALRG